MSSACLDWHHSRQLLSINYNDKLYSETEAVNALISRDGLSRTASKWSAFHQ